MNACAYFQPDDRGTINDKQVIRSIRKGTQAIHYVLDPTDLQKQGHAALKPGEKVKAVIDWKRRFDHMQQHSGI